MVAGIQIRDLPVYSDDPGTGVRVEPGPGWVEIGVTYDGSERWSCRILVDDLEKIIREAADLGCASQGREPSLLTRSQAVGEEFERFRNKRAAMEVRP